MTYEKWWYNFKNHYKGVLLILIAVISIMVAPFYCNKNFSSDPLEDAISKYYKETGRIIYPYGKECLKKEGNKRGLKTIDEYYYLIKENEKWF